MIGTITLNPALDIGGTVGAVRIVNDVSELGHFKNGEVLVADMN